MLRSVRNFFGNIGSIQVLENGRVFQYEVSGFKNIAIILNHFNQYPLQTTRSIDLSLLSMAVNFYNLHKPPPSYEGYFHHILAIKAASTPNGVSDPKDLQVAFPQKLQLLPKPLFSPSLDPLDPHWIAGFVSAEGSFGLNYTKDPRRRLGETLRPSFRVFQDAL